MLSLFHTLENLFLHKDKTSGSVRADSFLYKHNDNVLSGGRLFVFLSILYFVDLFIIRGLVSIDNR